MEGRLTKKLSPESGRTEGALSKLDKYLPSPQNRVQSRIVSETSRNTRRKPGTKWRQFPEWSLSWSRYLSQSVPSLMNSDPDEAFYRCNRRNTTYRFIRSANQTFEEIKGSQVWCFYKFFYDFSEFWNTSRWRYHVVTMGTLSFSATTRMNTTSYVNFQPLEIAEISRTYTTPWAISFSRLLDYMILHLFSIIQYLVSNAKFLYLFRFLFFSNANFLNSFYQTEV